MTGVLEAHFLKYSEVNLNLCRARTLAFLWSILFYYRYLLSNIFFFFFF